ncbi:hypothetical protein VKT23_001563 [Stygiomarasmius scandens]|uniref:Uncharacterized protein n=1 Tax=Marasmiellus scandens TaxID=2682957 RepID=A0ABR1K0S7_9AGAR
MVTSPSGHRRHHCKTCHKPMLGHPRGKCTSRRSVSLLADKMSANLTIFDSNTTPSRSSSPLSVIPDKDEDEDDKFSVRELDHYPPTTPNYKDTSDYKPTTLPEPVAVIHDDKANPLLLQSRPNTHFGVLLTEKSDGSYRQLFVSGEKSIVRKVVTAFANSMPGGRVAKDSEMQEYPVITQLIFSCILVSIFVVIGRSLI